MAQDGGIPFRPDLASRLHRPTAEEIAATREPIAFLWDRRIPKGKVTVLAGAGGTGKSSFLVGLALARATGHPFLGVPTAPGATLFLSAEDSMTDYLRKVDAWRSLYPSLDAEAIAQNVSIWEFIGEDFRLVSSRYGETVANPERIDEISRGVLTLDPLPDLIVIETASRFGAGDENANGAAAALIAACERLCEATGAAVLLMTHVGKSAARSATLDAYAPRGASAMTDNARSVLVLSDIPKGTDSAARNAQERILGRHLDEGEDLLVLAAGKSNFAPRASHVVMERIATPFGLGMRSVGGVRGPASQSEDEIRAAVARASGTVKEQRRIIGERLRAVVAQLAAEGHLVTARKLRTTWLDATGLKLRQVNDAVSTAVTDGFLEEVAGERGAKSLKPRFNSDPSADPVHPDHPDQPGSRSPGSAPLTALQADQGATVYGSDPPDPPRSVPSKGLFGNSGGSSQVDHAGNGKFPADFFAD